MPTIYCESEIAEHIDAIQADIEVSAEVRNALHACRPNHPLGKGKPPRQLFHNAAFLLMGRPGVPSRHVEWLRGMSESMGLGKDIEAEIATIVNGGYLDDISDHGVAEIILRIDPAAKITLSDDGTEYSASCSDGSSFRYDRTSRQEQQD